MRSFPRKRGSKPIEFVSVAAIWIPAFAGMSGKVVPQDQLYRLQRKPQLAQASAGVLDLSA
jgi:hypothetical protein